MDIATVIGIVGGSFLMVQAVMMDGGGGGGGFLDIPSVLITGGGTVCAVLVAFTLQEIKTVPQVLRKAIFKQEYSIDETLTTLVRLAEKARREGLLALEDDLEGIDDSFMRKGIQLVVDGTDHNMVRDVLETDLMYLESRHARGRSILETAAASAPAFGMIGTLIGLVKMLTTLDDPSRVGPGMATALLTTLYGAVMAYLLFAPLARKLALNSKKEVLVREMMLEGILSILSGQNPRIIQEKLKSFLPPQKQSEVEEIRRPSGSPAVSTVRAR
jgi:chemotaxis protein MotA